MTDKINWLAWLLMVILWNYGFPDASPFEDVIVAFSNLLKTSSLNLSKYFTIILIYSIVCLDEVENLVILTK